MLIELTEPALFVAAFNNEDPGVVQVAQRCTYAFSRHITQAHQLTYFSLVFGLPPSFVAAALGGGDIGVEQVAGLEAKVRSAYPSSTFRISLIVRIHVRSLITLHSAPTNAYSAVESLVEINPPINVNPATQLTPYLRASQDQLLRPLPVLHLLRM